MRVLIRYELPVGDFSELARQAYVDAAFTHFSIPGKRMSFARVAMLTGLSRKEVVRLSEKKSTEDQQERTTPSLAQRVIQGWINDPEYLTRHGYPRVLPFSGTACSFTTLVKRYGTDNTPFEILEELLCNEVVFRDHRSGIHLKKLGCIPQADELEKVHSMAECVADLMNTAVHNIESHDSEPLFQRQLAYTNVSASTAERFRFESAELSTRYLQQINRLLADVRSDSVSCSDSRRVGFGIYYFEASPASTDTDGVRK